MKLQRLWVQALAVIVLASWRLANPAVVEAGGVGACGQVVCVGAQDGCAEGEFQCAECPGYVCIGTGHFPCPSFYAIYCNAPE